MLDPIHLVIVLACFGVGILIVTGWRHIIVFLFQTFSVLIACGGLLLAILSTFWPEIPFVKSINDILMNLLDPLPRSTGRLFVVLLIYSCIPLTALFRAICFRIFPWLEIFNYPPELRDAFLATGIRPTRSRDDGILRLQIGRRFATGILASIVILAPLIVLHLHGNATATRVLKILSDVGLLLFLLGMASVGTGNRQGDL